MFKHYLVHFSLTTLTQSCRWTVYGHEFYFSSVQLLGCVWLFVTPWTASCQASLSITNAQSLPKLMSIESVMPYNHLILCRPLLLLPSIFPSIWVFSKESVLHIRWPKYWNFSFSINPSNEYSGLISLRMDWLDLLAVQEPLKSLSNTTVQKHQFFGANQFNYYWIPLCIFSPRSSSSWEEFIYKLPFSVANLLSGISFLSVKSF